MEKKLFLRPPNSSRFPLPIAPFAYQIGLLQFVLNVPYLAADIVTVINHLEKDTDGERGEYKDIDGGIQFKYSMPGDKYLFLVIDKSEIILLDS